MTNDSTMYGDRYYSPTDFAKAGVDIEHPLSAHRLPVLKNTSGNFKFHTAIVIGGESWVDEGYRGIDPTSDEVGMLLVDLEYRMQYYNDHYRRKVEARGMFDVDGSVNMHTFKKTPLLGWQYNVYTWTQGPTWAPYHHDKEFKKHTLAELLERVHTFGGVANTRWTKLRDESGRF